MALKQQHFLLIGIMFFVDRITKIIAATYFVQPIKILPFLQLNLVMNQGIAFGLLNEFNLRWLLSLISFAVIVWLWWFAKKQRDQITLYAVAFIIAGAAGNLIDRLFLGSVTDFIDFMIWPAFNVADAALTIGVISLLCAEVGKK